MECFTLREFGGQVGSPSHLKLITIHRAKGLEFDAVIIMGLEQGRLPWMNIAPKQKAEQRRQFYVALTRSKREVHFTYSGFTVNRWGRRFDNGRSEFVDEVERKLRQQEK